MLLPRRQRANGGMSTAEQARRAARAEALRRQAKAFNEALGKSKFERSAPVRIGHLDQVHTFVTDVAPDGIRQICQDREVRLIEAGRRDATKADAAE